MYVQAETFRWDKKLKACKTEKERNELILSSGKETVCSRIHCKTGERFYRPCIGKFVIIGIYESDNFAFINTDEAFAKGIELRELLIKQNSIL